MRAMILAAGRGERMRPLTDTLPKPLLTAAGKPLIVWHIERLVRAGIREIVINHAWLGRLIEERLGDGRHYGASISYSPETQALETAGGIAQALDFFRGEPFLVVNGDIWCDWDPAEALHLPPGLAARGRLAWLLLVPNPPHHPRGDFALEPDGVLQAPAAEEPHARAPLNAVGASAAAADPIPSGLPASVHLPETAAPGEPLFTFSGIGVYHPALFAGLEKGRPAPLAPLLRQAMRAGQVAGRVHQGAWMDVGTPERLREVDRMLGGQAGAASAIATPDTSRHASRNTDKDVDKGAGKDAGASAARR